MTKPHLRETILEYLKSDGAFLQLVSEVEKTHDIILFGGVVRDYIVGMSLDPRDFDMVLYPRGLQSDNILTLLRYVFPEDNISKNQFGGYKVQDSHMKADIWLLCDTWAFKEGLLEATLNNLTKSVFLNIDAYAYHFTNMYFIEQCDENNLPYEIDYVLEKNPKLLLNIIRALEFSDKYDIELSTRLRKLAIESLSGRGCIQRAILEQQLHYGEIILSEEKIAETIIAMNMKDKEGRP